MTHNELKRQKFPGTNYLSILTEDRVGFHRIIQNLQNSKNSIFLVTILERKRGAACAVLQVIKNKQTHNKQLVLSVNCTTEGKLAKLTTEKTSVGIWKPHKPMKHLWSSNINHNFLTNVINCCS